MVWTGFHESDIKNTNCLKNVFQDKEKLRKVEYVMVWMGFHLSDIKNRNCLKNFLKDKEKLRKLGSANGVNGFPSEWYQEQKTAWKMSLKTKKS